jgi:retinol dehydrogenase 12
MGLAMVTGPTSGIGRAVAKELSRLGHHVIAAGRSKGKVDEVVGEIVAAGGSAEALIVDLASLTSVRDAAGDFVASGRQLDVLVNNAGVAVARGATADGFEIQFGVNHLGHFMLTRQLGPAFGAGSRVVQVSSNMHYRAKAIDFERVTNRTRSTFGVPEYGVSKLANVLFVRELSRRHPELDVYAVHPGTVNTGIFPWYVRPFLRGLLTPEEGADTVVWCATAPGLVGKSGGYYARRTERVPSDVALDDHLAAELWWRSEEWCRSVAPG